MVAPICRSPPPRAPKPVKRQYIQMIAAARQGDPVACRELGLRYLHGRDGFPRHQRTALAYLAGTAAGATPEATQILAEGMPLEDLVLAGHEATLRQAAVSGSELAQIKLAAWLLVRHGDGGCARTWLSVAAQSGNRVARESLITLQTQGSERASFHLLTMHCGATGSDVARLNAIAARKALDSHESNDAVRCLRSIAALDTPLTADLVETTLAVLELASTGDLAIDVLGTSWIESCLRWASERGSPMAHYFLGRAMCGISSGRLEPRQLTHHLNQRLGSALLLRSADGGIDDAWLHLYRIHAAPKSSVANPPLARVFLEKAARHGSRTAQRMLGALLLSEAVDVGKAEQAISWLHQAAGAGDSEATGLLETLVIRPGNREAEACDVINEIRSRDAQIASRLLLARHFGLTKREATLVNPATGRRAWGLVVERNPFFVKPGLCAPRALPILSEAAEQSLQWAASLHQDIALVGDTLDTDSWKRWTKRLDRVIERHRIEPSLFFASITSDALEVMRGGPRWAAFHRTKLRSALSLDDLANSGTAAPESAPGAR